MDRNEAWKCFENSGRVEDYLTYRALENKKEQEYDAQSQRNPAENRIDRP